MAIVTCAVLHRVLTVVCCTKHLSGRANITIDDISFDVQSRQEALAADSDGLARDASTCAIRMGDLDKAIEFLEAGRSVFWSQILSLRSPFNKLHDVDQKLATRMQEIATALELGSHRDEIGRAHV